MTTEAIYPKYKVLVFFFHSTVHPCVLLCLSPNTKDSPDTDHGCPFLLNLQTVFSFWDVPVSKNVLSPLALLNEISQNPMIDFSKLSACALQFLCRGPVHLKTCKRVRISGICIRIYSLESPGHSAPGVLHENKPVTVRTQMSSGYQSTCGKALAVVCRRILSSDAYRNLEMYESGIEGRTAFPIFRVN